MKKLLLALLLGMFMVSCHKSNDNNTSTNTSAIPQNVKNAFATRFPAATGQIEWEKEDGDTFKVKFFIGMQRWQAIFTSSGTFIEEKQI